MEAAITLEGISQELQKHASKNGRSDNDLTKLLDESRIDPTEPLSPPPICWLMVNPDGSQSTMGTLGEFSLIIGKAKSKKTFFISLAVSAMVKNGLILDRFKGCLLDDKGQVIYFDTEQGKYHAQKTIKRICRLIGESNPKNLNAYGLRKFEPHQRLAIIEHAIYSNNQVGLVVIDGIRDLVNNINDEGEATMIATKLLKWTQERNIHIVTVLHQNKTDANARGHLGTELVNKAETVLSVSKSSENKEVSIVEAVFCRDKDPESFGFEICEDGLPHLTDVWQVKTAKKLAEVGPDDLTDIELQGLLAQCFFKQESLIYAELVNQMKLAFKKRMKRTIGRNKAVDIVFHCKNEGLIFQEKNKGPWTRSTQTGKG